MSLIKTCELRTDALPLICAWPGCFNLAERGKLYCSTCNEEEQAKKRREQNKLRKRLSRMYRKVGRFFGGGSK